MAGQLRGEPQPVRDDGQLAPAAAGLELPGDGECGGARVHDDALAVAGRARGRRADPRLLVRLEPLADVERELRPAPVGHDRTAVRPNQAAVSLEGQQVLADRDGGHAEAGGQIAHAGTSVLLDDAGDVVLAFASEDVPRVAAGRQGHGAPTWSIRVVTRVSNRVPAHLRTNVNAMSRKQIEINRKLWHAVLTWPRSATPGCVSLRPGGSVPAGGPSAAPPPPVPLRARRPGPIHRSRGPTIAIEPLEQARMGRRKA